MAIRSESAPGATARVILTLGEFTAELRKLPAAELEKRVTSPVLLVDPPAPETHDFDPVPTTAVGIRTPAPTQIQKVMGEHRLVVPLTPAPLNSTPSRLSVGRSTVCDLWLPYSGVSKMHAVLEIVGPDSCLVEDLGSTNGTSVGDRKLKPNQKVPVAEGGVMSFGDIPAEFHSAAAFVQILRVRIEHAA